jgi:hypothetical protein
MLQNALHHDLIFILKERVVIVLASSLTRSLLLDMYSPVNVLLIIRQMKNWDSNFSMCYDIWFLLHIGLENKNSLYYSVFIFINRNYLYLLHPAHVSGLCDWAFRWHRLTTALQSNYHPDNRAITWVSHSNGGSVFQWQLFLCTESNLNKYIVVNNI